MHHHLLLVALGVWQDGPKLQHSLTEHNVWLTAMTLDLQAVVHLGILANRQWDDLRIGHLWCITALSQNGKENVSRTTVTMNSINVYVCTYVQEHESVCLCVNKCIRTVHTYVDTNVLQAPLLWV